MRLRWTSLILVLVAVAACGDDAADPLPFDSTTTAVVTTAPTTTTTAATTTTGPTTTATPPTTLGPPPRPPVQFNPDGIGFARFGEDAETVAALAVEYFGTPSRDSGWLAAGFGDYGVCPGTRFRQLFFLGDTLMLMFSDADFFTPGGVDNFIHYGYAGLTPITLGPPVSIDVGNTVAQLSSMWPGAVIDGEDPVYGSLFYFDPGPGYEYLFATLTGITPGDVARYVSGGVGCGE
jgi:hypothetical protein